MGLTAGGLALVLYFAALFAWQLGVVFQGGGWVPLPATLLFTDQSLLDAGKAAQVLPFIPELPWSPNRVVTLVLERVHVGLVFALLVARTRARSTGGASPSFPVAPQSKHRGLQRLRRGLRRGERRADREPHAGK
jgi:hypothetical protein